VLEDQVLEKPEAPERRRDRARQQVVSHVQRSHLQVMRYVESYEIRRAGYEARPAFAAALGFRV